jgi:hypothetical protein
VPLTAAVSLRRSRQAAAVEVLAELGPGLGWPSAGTLDEQRRFVARLHEQLAEIDRAKAALGTQRKAIDALPAALLREVFGEVSAA